MLCEGLVACSLLFGGATFHFTDKYAPNGGYNWNNQTIGIEVLKENKEVYYNVNFSRFKDSFNVRSFTANVGGGYNYRFNAKYALKIGLQVGYGVLSYYKGIVVVPALQFDFGNYGMYALGLPNMGNNDGFINTGLKVRF